jgi:hypothetical protein
MPRPTAVQPLPGFRIQLRYDDGVEGVVDLFDLAGRGVFEAWNDSALFESVRLSPQGAIQWGSTIEVCPDAMYLRLTGKSAADVFPALRSAGVGA